MDLKNGLSFRFEYEFDTRIEGVKTTTAFLRRLLQNPRFQRGKVTTGMLDEK